MPTTNTTLHLIGPDPQIIDDAWWWKLLAAAETLTEAVIPHCGNGGLLYPLEFVRAVAVTWCYSARRSNEIKRLRVGCIRWQWEDTIIPLLCERAGVPRMDKRGNITSHRAHTTIASLYYNAPEGLTSSELQQFLGHRHSRSTQAYVKPSPTKLAKSVQRANKHSRLVKVLVDPSAAMQGEPAIFYDLGDGTFCGNPAWASC